MGMGPEAFAALDSIVVEYAKHAKLNSFGVIITGETKGLPAIEPAMVGVATGCCFMKDRIAHIVFLYHKSTPPALPYPLIQVKKRDPYNGIRLLYILFGNFPAHLYHNKNCMRRICLLCALVGVLAGGAVAQDSLLTTHPHARVYTIKPSIDIPLVVGGAAWDLYGFSQISKKNSTSIERLNSLKISNLDWFDRWAVHPYSHSIDKLCYVPFYVAMPLPLAVFGIDNRMRKDFWKLTYLYGEAMILTGVLYTSAVHYVSRLRPLTYESSSPLEERQSSNSRNSFFAGHVALVGTSVFFIAQAYADYHPESHYKWAFYSGAAVITGLTGYWRNKAGEHFPTDIGLGAVIGVASGLLTPTLHRTKLMRNKKLTLLPFSNNGKGLSLLYHL
jgi:membrane-associated phospholipid phosphatase